MTTVTDNIKANSNKDELVELVIMKNNESHISYRGRFIGFIDELQFNIIREHKDIIRKVFSKGTQSINVLSRWDNLNGLRLVLDVKQINGSPIEQRKLLMTSKLDFITCFIPRESAEIISLKGDIISIAKVKP